MRPWIVPALCIGWLAGIGLGSLADVPRVALQGAALVTGAVFALSRDQWRLRLVAMAVLALVFGVWWAGRSRADDAAQRAAWAGLYGRPAIIRGVLEEAQVRPATVRLTVGRIEVERRALPGTLRATVSGVTGLQERGTVVLRGDVVRPEDLLPQGTQPRGDIERVFDRHQVFAAMKFPSVSVKDAGRPSALAGVRETLRGVLLQQLPEPVAGLYSAFLLSFDHDLPRALRDKAAATGILHLVAISGSHIAALSAFVFLVGLVAGFARRGALLLTTIFTLEFLALIGFPESGVRSGIMATIVLAAELFGRQGSGLRALLLACALMTLQNPRILLGDVGFQLSALAVWGLLSLYPLLRVWLPWVPNLLGLRTLLFLTLSAEIATLPVVAYTFGRVPLVGPLTNLFAGYLFPVLLALGSLVIVLGLVFPGIAALVAPLAAVAGHAFLGLADLGARVPHHVVLLPPISLSAFVVGVVSLLLAVHGVSWRIQRAGAEGSPLRA